MMLRNLFLTLAFAASLFAAENVKSVDGVAKANIKSIAGVAEANIKSIDGVDNTASGGVTFPIVDTFDRDNVNPISNPTSDGKGNWTTPLITAAVEIDGNTADGTGSDSIAILNPTSGSFNANHIMTITIATTADVGCVVRATSIAAGRATGYMSFMANTTTVQIYQLADNGTGTTITQVGNNITVAAITAGDTISLSAHTSGGNAVLTVFKNGVAVVEADNPVTDTTSPYLTGTVGILCNGTTPSIQTASADNYTP